ncbi:hypothetical protein CVT26_001961 [Gymnopilus dilepis]|uniref:Uncharacterized protein n=1 Tax=Gymnopilus dilepis TaxID=231916 RepID=A0A409VC01_9AGAR|nr:hypothetical protein CVT26_001961 [Gymnopilus dilepis]
MASTAMRPFLLSDESVSLRSFRRNVVSPSPPSLKASSLKVKTSLVFSGFLRSRGRTEEPTLDDLIQAEADKERDILLPVPDSPAMPRMNSTATTVQTEESAPGRPRSKSRTIIRMISTKFTRVAQSPPAIVKPPPAAPAGWSKDQRDAALRERGLLPPLRPNKDLSLQESEQDRLIPVVEAVAEKPSGPSAADLIKKEWEAKNQNVEAEQRQRMNAFRFGGGASPVPPSPSDDKPLPPPSPSTEKLPPPSEPLPPLPAPALSPEPAPQDLSPRTSSLIAADVSSSQSTQIKVRPLPSPPVPKTPPAAVEIEPWTIPLPPSPSPSTSELPSAPESSAFASASTPPSSSQLPPQTPSLRSLPDTPQSQDSSVCGSGANTPRPLDHRTPAPSSPSPTLPPTPVISLTPATEAEAPLPSPLPPSEPTAKATSTSTSTAADDEKLSSAFHNRSDSFAQLEDSISSIATPSLDSTSNTTANSTAGTSDPGSPVSPNAVRAPGKLGLLQVKTQEVANTIPVIVQSPIEVSRFSEDLEVVMEESPSAEFGVLDEKSSSKPTSSGSKNAAPSSPRSPPPPSSQGTAPLRPQRRNVTDPATTSASTVDRRKSFNPFKRGQTIDVPPSSEPQRRLSVAKSLNNLRRSVVGTLSSKPLPKTSEEPELGGSAPSPAPPSAPRTRGRVEKKFDASHLPASPTIPSAYARPRPSDVSGSRSPPPTPGMRRAVSPVIYHRGSILLETAGIEDEETRRMTELAFLG